MTCSDCIKASLYAQHPQCNPACLYCGVRILQLLGRLNITNAECTRRRRLMLEVWLKQDHSEAVIRSLVPGPLCVGLAKTAASDAPTPSKSRSAGPKS